jgi:hypothetical protein
MEAERLWSEVILPIADGTQTFNAARWKLLDGQAVITNWRQPLR